MNFKLLDIALDGKDERDALRQAAPMLQSRDSWKDSDEELHAILDRRATRTLLIGVGGAGNNMVSRFQGTTLAENRGCRTMCVNTDVQDLYYSNSDEKVLIGKQLTRGLGAGNDPDIGELAALEDYERLKMLLDCDLVFLACGLGGGTGTGATSVIAKAARERGAIVVSIITLPFEMEGPRKQEIARDALDTLSMHSDTIIPLPNQRLMSLVPGLKLHQGFKIMDEILARSVSGTVNLVSRPGLVNLDFADVRSVIKRKG